MRNLSDYTRPDGVLVNKNGDGGDGAMKTAMLATGFFGPDNTRGVAPLSLEKSIKALFISPGILIRCPNDGTPWHANPKCTSCDQTIGWFCVFALYGLWRELLSLTWAHVKRFGFCQNWQTETGTFQIADPLRFDAWGIVIRGFHLWFLWPLLLIFDLATLVNSIILIRKTDPDDVGDDQNHYVIMKTQMKIYPTPVSWLARKLYCKGRDVTYGCFMLNADYNDDDDAEVTTTYNNWKNGMMVNVNTSPFSTRTCVGPLWWYFRDSQGAPPMWRVWTEQIEEF